MHSLLIVLIGAVTTAASTAPQSPQDVADLRAGVMRGMIEAAGPLPSRESLAPLDVEEVETTDMGFYVRKKVLLTPEPGDRLPAYLLIPKGLTAKVPGMLCLHQTTALGKGETVGIGTTINRNYAQELAERGFVTLAPDYPNFGDYKIDVYSRGYASATAKGIANHMRCVDLLQSLPEVDPDRIGAIGHSLGGHNTLFVGLFDERIKVMVTSCGFTSFPKYYGGDLTGWSHKGYMPRIAEAYGKDPARMPFDFPQLLAALAPRAVFVNAPLHDDNFDVSGVRDCVAAAAPVYQTLGKAGNLTAYYPDCDHDFPPCARELAYEFLDKQFALQRPGKPDLRVGAAFHAFEHLGEYGHQSQAAAKSGANVIYGTGMGLLGYSGLPPAEELQITFNAEREYNEKAKADGIKTCIGYLCATSIIGLDNFDKNWTDDLRAKLATPPGQWLQQGRDGAVLASWYGGEYTPACMNNPQWRIYQRHMVRLQLLSGHDGIFFDNPTVHKNGCYCPHCMKKFAAFLRARGVAADGEDSTETLRVLADQHSRLFKLFRASIARDFLGEMAAYARVVKPGAVVTANNSLNSPDVFYSQASLLGYNIYEMSQAEDFVVVEDMHTQPRVTDEGETIEYGPMYRMTAAISHSKPLVAVTLAETDYHTPPNLVRLAMAEAAAHDAGYMLWSTWPESQRHKMTAAVRPQADWLWGHANLFESSSARRDVGLFVPYRRWLETDECAATDIARTLTENRMQYQAFCEDDFNLNELKKAPALLLENRHVVNEQERQIIKQYAASGGKVIYADESNWRDQMPAASLTIEGVPHVRGVVRDSAEWVALFLYNLNIRRKSSFEDVVTPAEDVRCRVRVPSAVTFVEVSSVDAIARGAIPFEQEGDVVSFEVPRLPISAIIIMQIKKPNRVAWNWSGRSGYGIIVCHECTYRSSCCERRRHGRLG